MTRAVFISVFLVATSWPSHAKPGSSKSDETQYLENAERYILEDSTAAMSVASPLPVKKPVPTPLPSPTPDEEDEESGEKTILGHARKVRPSPPAIVHDSKIFVGQEVPYPTDYSAPSIRTDINGFPVVAPSQPRSFQTRRVGVSMQNTNEGESIRVTELEGFVNYGNPISTVVPVYNEKGELIGTRVISVPNNILQPVFKTYQQER